MWNRKRKEEEKTKILRCKRKGAIKCPHKFIAVNSGLDSGIKRDIYPLLILFKLSSFSTHKRQIIYQSKMHGRSEHIEINLRRFKAKCPCDRNVHS